MPTPREIKEAFTPNCSRHATQFIKLLKEVGTIDEVCIAGIQDDKILVKYSHLSSDFSTIAVEIHALGYGINAFDVRDNQTYVWFYQLP